MDIRASVRHGANTKVRDTRQAVRPIHILCCEGKHTANPILLHRPLLADSKVHPTCLLRDCLV